MCYYQFVTLQSLAIKVSAGHGIAVSLFHIDGRLLVTCQSLLKLLIHRSANFYWLINFIFMV